MGSKKIKYLFLVFFLYYCNIASDKTKIKPLVFDYKSISNYYFNPANPPYFPITIQKGKSQQPDFDSSGRYMVYSSDTSGSLDIWLRDTTTSVSIPLTDHPSSEYQPTISKDGKVLLFLSNRWNPEGELVKISIDPEDLIKKAMKGKIIEMDHDWERWNQGSFKALIKNSYFQPRFSDRDSGFYFLSKTNQEEDFLLFYNSSFEEKSIQIPIPMTMIHYTVPEDGSGIYFISREENKNGDIYFFENKSKKITRLTNSSLLKAWLSFNPKNQSIVYVSYINDSNQDGIINYNDNGRVIEKKLSLEKETILTPEDLDVVDIINSPFVGGSIVFTSREWENSKIQFFPSSGSFERVDSIEKQFQIAQKYLKNGNYTTYLIVKTDFENRFSNVFEFPFYLAKLESDEIQSGYKKPILLDKISSSLEAYTWIDLYFSTHASFNKEQKQKIERYGETIQNPLVMSFFYISYANSLLLREQWEEASRVIQSISFKENPFVESQLIQIQKRIQSSSDQVLIDEDKKNQLNIIHNCSMRTIECPDKLSSKYYSLKNHFYNYWKKHPEFSISETDPELLKKIFILYQAEKLYQMGVNAEASQLLDKIIGIPANVDLDPPGQVPVFEKKEFLTLFQVPLYLEASLLKFNTDKSLGKIDIAFKNLRTFVEFYSPDSGLSLSKSELEKILFYFENRAINYEKNKDYEQAGFHYFYNNQLLFSAKSRGLLSDDLYKKYSVYFQIKMVDALFLLSDKIQSESNLSINVVPLQTSNPMAERAFFWAEAYYKVAVPRARPYLDYATIYGYSYYLVEKSKRYDSFANKINIDSESHSEKSNRYLKEAQGELKWILYAAPEFVDAYNLLSFINFYTDSKKSKANESDRKKIELYFPERNLEYNIELLEQILSTLGSSYTQYKELSDLNLNLANTYYLLNNFKNADYYYSKVEGYSSKILNNIQFQSNEMNQVFLFQYARSALLSGNLKKANSIFSKLLSELENIFTKEYRLNKESNIINKLSLVHSMAGITSIEQGNWQACIKSFESTLSYNKLSKTFPQSMIHLAMGICYQKQGRWQKSEEQVNLAMKISDYPDFPEEESALWNTLLPDSVRVIGDSRYPGAFKKKDLYLLASGVSLNNKIEQSEYGNALIYIDDRLKYINTNLKTNSTIPLRIKNQSSVTKGYLYYNNNQFEEAYEHFNDSETVKSWNQKWITLFQWAEKVPRQKKWADLIQKELNSIPKWRGEIIEECIETNSNNDNLVSNKDALNEYCHDQLKKDYRNLEWFVSLAHYYLSENHFNNKDSFLQIYELGLALNHAQKYIEYLQFNPRDSKKERINFLNYYSNIYLKLGDHAKSEELAQEAYSRSTTDKFPKHTFQSLILLCQIYKSNDQLEDFNFYYNKLTTIYESNPILKMDLTSNEIDSFFTLNDSIAWESGNIDSFWESKESRSKAHLIKNFITARLEYKNPEKQSDYQKLRYLILNNQKSEFDKFEIEIIKKYPNWNLFLGTSRIPVSKFLKSDEVLFRYQHFSDVLLISKYTTKGVEHKKYESVSWEEKASSLFEELKASKSDRNISKFIFIPDNNHYQVTRKIFGPNIYFPFRFADLTSRPILYPHLIKEISELSKVPDSSALVWMDKLIAPISLETTPNLFGETDSKSLNIKPLVENEIQIPEMELTSNLPIGSIWKELYRTSPILRMEGSGIVSFKSNDNEKIYFNPPPEEIIKKNELELMQKATWDWKKGNLRLAFNSFLEVSRTSNQMLAEEARNNLKLMENGQDSGDLFFLTKKKLITSNENMDYQVSELFLSKTDTKDFHPEEWNLLKSIAWEGLAQKSLFIGLESIPSWQGWNSNYALGFQGKWAELESSLNTEKFDRSQLKDSIYDQYRKNIYKYWIAKNQNKYTSLDWLIPRPSPYTDSKFPDLSGMNRALVMQFLIDRMGSRENQLAIKLLDQLNEDEISKNRKSRSMIIQILMAEKFILLSNYSEAKSRLEKIKDSTDSLPAVWKDKLSYLSQLAILNIKQDSLPPEMVKSFGWSVYLNYESQSVLDSKNTFIKRFQNAIQGGLTKEEWKSLLFELNYLQDHVFQKDLSSDFLEIQIWKDKLNRYDYFLGYPLNNLSAPVLLIDSLQKSLGQNREWIGLVPYKNKIISITLTQTQSKGKEFYKDQQLFYDWIDQYHQNANSGGSWNVLRENIEDKFKKTFSITSSKTYYLYTPIELRYIPLYYKEEFPVFWVYQTDGFISTMNQNYFQLTHSLKDLETKGKYVYTPSHYLSEVVPLFESISSDKGKVTPNSFSSGLKFASQNATEDKEWTEIRCISNGF
jgi:hypothetical protein